MSEALPFILLMPQIKHHMNVKHITISPLLRLLFLIILNISVALCAGDGDETRFAYSGFAGVNLTTDGNATITPNGLLVLTSSKTNLQGHAFYPTPLQFSTSPNSGKAKVPSFAASFVFAIVSNYTDFSAHGMAFVVAPNKSFPTALPAGYLALLNVQHNSNSSNHLFAVELDTTQNTDFQDINANHVGIDINDLHSVQSSATGYYDDDNGGVFRNLTLFSREAMQVWVEYEGEKGRIDVTVVPIKVARKPARPLVSAIYDLSTVLKEQSYIGLSSATGGINARHYVLGWSFAMNGTAPAIDIASRPKLPRFGPKPRSKVLEIVLPIATAAIIITAGTVAALVVLSKLRYAELLEDWELEFGPQRFSFKDLYHATSGFKSKHLLGADGFGKVYKGVLAKSKLEVAVKRISHESRQVPAGQRGGEVPAGSDHERHAVRADLDVVGQDAEHEGGGEGTSARRRRPVGVEAHRLRVERMALALKRPVGQLQHAVRRDGCNAVHGEVRAGEAGVHETVALAGA